MPKVGYTLPLSLSLSLSLTLTLALALALTQACSQSRIHPTQGTR